MISKKVWIYIFLRRKLDEEQQHGQQGKGRKRMQSGRNRGKKAGHTAVYRGLSKEGQRKIWRRKRTKRCPAERKPVQGRQQGPHHLK